MSTTKPIKDKTDLEAIKNYYLDKKEYRKPHGQNGCRYGQHGWAWRGACFISCLARCVAYFT